MTGLAKLQIVGPIVISAVILAEELAAYALGVKPSSEFLWYLNLQLFSIFQKSHYVFSGHFAFPYFQLLFVAVPLLLLTLFGLAFRRALLLAVASNLSLVYSCFLAYAWHTVESPSQQAASLAGLLPFTTLNLSAQTLPAGPHAYVLMALLIPTLLSFTASHVMYIRAARGLSPHAFD